MDQWKVFIADFHSTYDVLRVLYGRINVATSCKIPHGCKINKKFKQVRIKTAGALSGSLPLNHVWILTIHILPPERVRNKQTHNYPGTVIHFFGFLVLTLVSVEVFTWHDTPVLSLVFELCSFSFLKRLCSIRDTRQSWRWVVHFCSFPWYLSTRTYRLQSRLSPTFAHRNTFSSVFCSSFYRICGCYCRMPACQVRHWVRVRRL